jgi:hypothetical protein
VNARLVELFPAQAVPAARNLATTQPAARAAAR